MIHKEIVVGPFQCNCKILACPKTGEAVIVDPGDESKEILKALKNLKTPSGQDLKVKYLFHTHAHLDHIAATRDVREDQVSSKIALHKNDEILYQQLKMQGGFFGLNLSDPLPIEHYFEDEEIISVGSLKFSIIHTPGHSPGGVSIRLHENSESNVKEMLFSGDTLFQGSIGRTDLWGGDFDILIKSIRQRIFSLDDDIPVCPGHGPNTLVGIEKRENPFCS